MRGESMTTLIYRKPTHAACLIALALVLVTPNAAFGLLLQSGQLSYELAHLLFELFESILDHLVEHLFHTNTQETQLIVFYLMLIQALGVVYWLSCAIRRLVCQLKENLQTAVAHYKANISGYWAASAGNKFKLIAGFNAVLTLAYWVGF